MIGEWVTDSAFVCPWCGKTQSDVWEFIGDLHEGDTYECQYCEKGIEILQIDHVAHLYIRPTPVQSEVSDPSKDKGSGAPASQGEGET